ncbi:ectonucleoside triphosphate diphosphohydrolase 8-like isoform X2 [Amphiura filiformis]|uniref:ectonucleoside triphosphate diphosphohydrolase 8-like isoform X2 n=1 Tax=Amphiura filiformis TaxID=82378 RepID=UPI003B212170
MYSLEVYIIPDYWDYACDHHDQDEAVPINKPLMPSIRQPKCARWLVLFILGCLCALISLLGVVILSVFYVKDCVESGHGIVFDAGSSHTNMSIYKWPDDTTNGTGKVQQIGSCQAEGGGIADYQENPAEAGPSLEGCLDQAKSNVAQDEHKATPQYLGATAGMRLLNATEPSTSNAIFESVREVMGSYPFNFTRPLYQARILQGGEEGTFGWLSTNYLSNTLNEGPGSLMESVTTALSYVTSGIQADAKPTLGAMDLGGASTQMSFIPEDPSALPAGYDYYLRLYGTDYHVYSHSYLCYGINEILRRYKAQIVENSGYLNATDNPCAAVGYTEAVDAAYLWTPPCSTPHGSGPNATTYYLVGTSNAVKCAEITSQLFNYTTCDKPPCSFDGVHQPKPYGKFLAFSVFAKVFEGLNLSTKPTMKEVNDTRYDFCNKTYDELKAMPGYNKYLLLYCFEIHYIWTLWVDGYKFGEDNWDIEVVSDIKGVELGWSLGYMINATNRIPVESTCMEVPDSAFYGVLAALVIIFILGFVLIIAGFLSKRNSPKHPYEEADQGYGGV